MLSPAAIEELCRHIPVITGRRLHCSCGWHMKDDSEKPWATFCAHLAAPPRLVLSEGDVKFLNACHIKLNP